jgi:ubiquinone/menaquinone biosynthesis C-methylase UbiE
MIVNDLSTADQKGVIRALPQNLSHVNEKRIRQFSAFMFLYDLIQEHWVRNRIHKADPSKHGQIMHDLIAPVKNATVLDMACGTGSAIKHFDSSNKYTGLDISYSMLRQARKKARKKLFRSFRLVEGNAEEALFEDQTFDFVLIDTALHMIPRYQKCIENVSRVLKTGGTLLVSCPTFGINQKFDALWEKIAPKRHLNVLTESTYELLCSSSGMTYQRMQTNGSMVYFKGAKITSLNLS